MPHLRKRHVLNLLIKRLKFNPVLTLQGARQTGKSVLVRDILAKEFPKAKYVTFDSLTEAKFANSNPESFLFGQQDYAPLIIDEAQKAPHIFDAVKLNVDQRRRPGQYVLLGSTEFSHLTRVRESLTGRMSRVRLYPLTLSETIGLSLRNFRIGKLFQDPFRVSRAQLMKQIHCGGMPGIFAVRDEAERNRLLEDWLKLTCERDALQVRGMGIDPDLCFSIMTQIAKLDEPNAGAIAKGLLRDVRKVKAHLEVLETLFVVQKISPMVGSSGKPIYYLLDVALASFLGASFQKCLTTLIKTEIDALIAYHDVPLTRVTYFRSRAGSLIHFIVESKDEVAAVKILNQESLDLRDLEILKSFRNKVNDKKVFCYALGSGRFSLQKEKVEVFPWESVG